jgi:hypothetical protein
VTYRWSALALVLFGCGGSKEDRPPSPPATAPTHRAIEVERFAGPPVVLPLEKEFVVLDGGQGAPHTLRYMLRPATTSYMAKTALTSRRLAGGTWTAAHAMPAIENGLAITVTAGDALVARVLPGVIDGAATPDAQQYLAAWKPLEDRRLTLTVDARGRLGAIAFADDPTTQRSATEKDEIVQRLLATLIPLPEEPVGVGAKWRVVTALRQRPAIVKQTATYTLEAITRDGWTIGVDVRRIGESQRLIEPALPRDAVVDLVALVRALHGSLAVDPRAVFGAGELVVSSTIHVRATAAGRGASEEIVEDTGTITLSAAR